MECRMVGRRHLRSFRAYQVYKDCMYLPTFRKYLKKMDSYVEDERVCVLGTFDRNRLTGILVLKCREKSDFDIEGIAAGKKARGKGVGTFMLKEAVNLTGVEAFFAETDVDAVGFYKKCGFVCEKHLNHYEDGDVERFECYLKVEKQKY